MYEQLLYESLCVLLMNVSRSLSAPALLALTENSDKVGQLFHSKKMKINYS